MTSGRALTGRDLAFKVWNCPDRQKNPVPLLGGLEWKRRSKTYGLRNMTGEEFRLVFYHFQNLRYLPGKKVNIKSQTKNRELKYRIYIPYLREIEKIRAELKEEYGLSFEPKKLQRSSNPVVGFLQRHFAAYKVRSLSDIIDLKQLDKYRYQ